MSDPKAYPRMLYAADGSTKIVPDEAAHQAAGPGWSLEPADVHRAQGAVVQPLPSGQEPFVEAVASRTAELVLAALKAEVPPLPETPPPPAKRGRASPAAERQSDTPDLPTESGE